MLARDIEFRVLASLTTLRAAVIESTLGFSIIRWHNTEDAQNPETLAEQ
jgi:hypothetical protein